MPLVGRVTVEDVPPSIDVSPSQRATVLSMILLTGKVVSSSLKSIDEREHSMCGEFYAGGLPPVPPGLRRTGENEVSTKFLFSLWLVFVFR